MKMFFSRKPKVEELSKSSIGVLEPVDQDDVFVAEYNRVAKKMGVVMSPSSGVAARAVLSEEMIEVYDLAAVERYMDKQGYWHWYPMANGDSRKYISNASEISRKTPHAHGILFGGVKRFDIYNKPVPLAALLTAERLRDRCGDEVSFFVAALDQHPDPFLGVTFSENPTKIYVVERWDEPGFRG